MVLMQLMMSTETTEFFLKTHHIDLHFDLNVFFFLFAYCFRLCSNICGQWRMLPLLRRTAISLPCLSPAPGQWWEQSSWRASMSFLTERRNASDSPWAPAMVRRRGQRHNKGHPVSDDILNEGHEHSGCPRLKCVIFLDVYLEKKKHAFFFYKLELVCHMISGWNTLKITVEKWKNPKNVQVL